MAIDTPARLAILGAGPIGLEAALYARFLGYDVVVYEQGQPAASVRRWGHVRMFSPFATSHSTLGLAAIQSQEVSYRPPAPQKQLTGNEWIERYLGPMSQTDLLSDHLRLETAVLAVGKEELLKTDLPGAADRGDWSFRVLSRDGAGQERMELFDGVLDCSGVFSCANWLGHGGLPAVGELGLRNQIEYRLLDLQGADRARYAGKHTLLVGAGMSAATNLVALVELSKTEPETRVTWITRREGVAGAGGPVEVNRDDLLSARAALARQANELACHAAVTHWPRTVVERIQATDGNRFDVERSGDHGGTITVDRIVANVGFRPDPSLYRELQVRSCFAMESADERTAPTQIEPNFYILGAKSYGRRCDFLFQTGLDQIRQVFAIIGDRETLDLYAGAQRLLT